MPNQQIFDSNKQPGVPRAVAGIRPLAVRRPGAAFLLGCGETTVDDLIARGLLDARKNGKSLIVTMASIEKYLASLPKARLKPYQRKAATKPVIRRRLRHG